jgi:hypothetical protein
MITITLPPELERIISQRAHQQGTTPELWTLDKLRQSIEAELPDESSTTVNSDGDSMLDFFSGYVGVLHSSEKVPGGARMSEDTGRKLAEGMFKKQA